MEPCDPVPVDEPVLLAVVDALAVCVGDAVRLLVAVLEGDAVTEGVSEGVIDDDAVIEADAVAVREDVSVDVWLGT